MVGGRPVTSGQSHNKASNQYLSKRKALASENQPTLTSFFKKPKSTTENEADGIIGSDEENSGGGTTPVVSPDNTAANSDEDNLLTQSDLDESDHSSPTCSADGSIDGRVYMSAQQSQAKLEEKYSWAFYSAAERGWFCKVCQEYGEEGQQEHWVNRAVRTLEHPGRVFKGHLDSKKHKTFVQKRVEVQRMLTRGSVYRSLIESSENSRAEIRGRNRRVIKKFLKTTYFLARKKWAIRENFTDTIHFLKNLGDTDIESHLAETSKRATYISTSVDEYLKCISNYLEEEQVTRIVTASEFSLLADETTDVADRAELATFIRYVDSDSHEVKEEFLGIVEVVGKKGAECLCKKICDVLRDKGINISQMVFSGLDGTNTMSGEISGLQRRLRHYSPHMKYVNCRNHRLALVFVHLLKKFRYLEAVDSVLLAVWKMFKYSTVKSAVFSESQTVDCLKVLKLLKAAPTRWLSHGEASARVVMRFEALVNALDTLIAESGDAEIKGIRDQLLDPDIILFLLLLADVLTHVNRFSKFLQTSNLVYSDIAIKLCQLNASLQKLLNEDGHFFSEYAATYLSLSKERKQLSKALRSARKLPEDEDRDIVGDKIIKFNTSVKAEFLKELQLELGQALAISDSVFLSFDVFHPVHNFSDEVKTEKLQTLATFYGSPNASTFQGDTTVSDAIMDRHLADNKQCISLFFESYAKSLEKDERVRNKLIVQMVREKKLKPGDVESYKENHPIKSSQIYADMYSSERLLYADIMKLFKLSLLIPPTTSNVERGFSTLNLMHSKQRNCLSPKSLDKLMRINLLGPEELDDITWEELVDAFRDMGERRLDIT